MAASGTANTTCTIARVGIQPRQPWYPSAFMQGVVHASEKLRPTAPTPPATERPSKIATMESSPTGGRSHSSPSLLTPAESPISGTSALWRDIDGGAPGIVLSYQTCRCAVHTLSLESCWML